jgi:predicted regulator of Ras-like GTPase activity (Roadblock/LC7/MglB family)
MSAVETREFGVLELPEQQRCACQESLERLAKGIPGLMTCGLVGPDGFEIAAVSSVGAAITQLAALSTTLLAVADAFAMQSGSEACRDIIVGTNESCTLFLSVKVGLSVYALFVTAANAASLGSVLTRSRLCLAEIQETLSGVTV